MSRNSKRDAVHEPHKASASAHAFRTKPAMNAHQSARVPMPPMLGMDAAQ